MNAKDTGQVKLRLPDQLKQELQEKAELNTRTLNSEIVNRLSTSLRSEKETGSQNAKP